MLVYLRRNIQVFAWKIEDMLGVDPQVACHKLNILLGAKPIRQKRRPRSKENRKAIAEEIKKLNEVGFIKEVRYTIWFTNIIIVPKKNGKMRICIDFRDLKKACPKDSFHFLKSTN